MGIYLCLNYFLLCILGYVCLTRLDRCMISAALGVLLTVASIFAR